ncbi:MAG: arylesterase [Saprospiraceae bacterium]
MKNNNLYFFIFLLLFGLACKNEKTPIKKTITTNTLKVENDKLHVPTILFYGNSLTAGYGLDDEFSFPSRIQDSIKTLGLNYNVINAGLSGETTSGGLQRIDWVLKQKIDVFVLELGPNDMLRGLPIEKTRENLILILEKVKTKYPNIKIALCEMIAAPNMGKEYAVEFQKIYKDIANDMNIRLIPFFLNGVSAESKYLLPDGKHPNAKGQEIAAKNIWKGIQDWII